LCSSSIRGKASPFYSIFFVQLTCGSSLSASPVVSG
jgi:hypothetical protein